MGLTMFEKAAGRLFRDAAVRRLSDPDAPGGDEAASCPPVLAVWRHECEVREGRTRPIRLDVIRWTSPEIWVTWDVNINEALAEVIGERQSPAEARATILAHSRLEAIWPREAEDRLQRGRVAEYEVIVAGRFSFDWVHGECRGCRMHVRSRDGIFGENVPRMAHTGPGTERKLKPLPEVCVP